MTDTLFDRAQAAIAASHQLRAERVTLEADGTAWRQQLRLAVLESAMDRVESGARRQDEV